LGIGDWGLGIGDWGLGPIPNPQSPIPMSFLLIILNLIIFKKQIYLIHNYLMNYNYFSKLFNNQA
jgi:hypothetical protein